MRLQPLWRSAEGVGSLGSKVSKAASRCSSERILSASFRSSFSSIESST